MVQFYCSIVVLLSGLLFEYVVSQCEIANVCVADVTDDDCADGQEMVPFGGIFGCCPGCQPVSDVEVDTGCQPPANCLSDGRYAPVQCKGDLFMGRCFCSDEHGNRIFGQMWRNEATEMTCACSRRRAELEASSDRIVSLHCTTSGDYEPLQCDDGLCWCAEPKTGQPTVDPVPDADMTRLPCSTTGTGALASIRRDDVMGLRATTLNDDVATIGSQYLRRCESIVQAMATISGEQSAHGTNFLGNPTTFCDYDGTYGPYQITNGIAYCTGKDAEILGSWQVMSSEMAGMTCNCARDTTVYFPERGMTVTEVCLANGNYQLNQNVGDVYYCVDSDGYTVTDMLDEWPTDRCASFA